ncbi:MAG: AAA family ATPase [Thalassobaculum sp.]
MSVTLIVFSGLAGTGKTSIARELAAQLGAVFLRIDSIEWALAQSVLRIRAAEDAGYRAAYAVAEDNLRNGLSVVADSVNPIELTRDAWRAVATAAGVEGVDVEVVCSDRDEHRRRVESRAPHRPGARNPTWQQVIDRHYAPWSRNRVVIDTAGRTVEDCVEEVIRELGKR